MALLDKFNRFANRFSDLLGTRPTMSRAHVELGAASRAWRLRRSDASHGTHSTSDAIHARAHYLLGLCYLRRGQPNDLTAAKKALSDALAARATIPKPL